MSPTFFSPDLVKRCVMNPFDVIRFRAESQKHVLIDEATRSTIIIYRYPDGRTLVDEIDLFPTQR
jgi:signal peptidase I